MRTATRTTSGTSQVADDQSRLADLNADFIRAVQMSDTQRFVEILAADFLNSNPDGTLVDKQAFLAQIRRPATITNLAAEDVRIRLLADMAIIHGRTTYNQADGRAAAGRYTDVWVRRGGDWLCVAAHVTRG